VHSPGMCAGIRESRLLDDRQRVDVRAQRNARFIGIPDPRDRRGRRIGHTGNIFDPNSIQLSPNCSTGFVLFKTELRDLMKPMPQFCDARVLRFNKRLYVSHIQQATCVNPQPQATTASPAAVPL
jgi:hypothetical protein